MWSKNFAAMVTDITLLLSIALLEHNKTCWRQFTLWSIGYVSHYTQIRGRGLIDRGIWSPGWFRLQTKTRTHRIPRIRKRKNTLLHKTQDTHLKGYRDTFCLYYLYSSCIDGSAGDGDKLRFCKVKQEQSLLQPYQRKYIVWLGL